MSTNPRGVVPDSPIANPNLITPTAPVPQWPRQSQEGVTPPAWWQSVPAPAYNVQTNTAPGVVPAPTPTPAPAPGSSGGGCCG